MERLYPIDPIDAYVGERLKLIRNIRGLSQSYLGKYVDLTYQQIQKYESGANGIRSSTLAKFARLLGVPVAYFFQGLPTEYHGGGPSVAPSDELPARKDVLFRPETHRVIELYYALPNNQTRKVIEAYMQSFIQ